MEQRRRVADPDARRHAVRPSGADVHCPVQRLSLRRVLLHGGGAPVNALSNSRSSHRPCSFHLAH
eukprot:scaffold8166_cov376-Prasinococcus_capsulatus_cf.AAC.5